MCFVLALLLCCILARLVKLCVCAVLCNIVMNVLHIKTCGICKSVRRLCNSCNGKQYMTKIHHIPETILPTNIRKQHYKIVWLEPKSIDNKR